MAMTYLEKYRQMYPEDKRTDTEIIDDICPYITFGFRRPDCVDDEKMICENCWNTEVPEMTLDEAIKHCREVADGALCEGTVNHKACGEEHRQLVEWLEEYKALKEKSTPKTPDFEGDGYDDGGNIILDTWICPNCGGKHEVDYEKYDYCPECGQALSWEYPDEEDGE